MPFDGTNWNKRAELARASLEVLELLEARLAGGKFWCQWAYHKGPSACLKGALDEIREGRKVPDEAGRYLSRAISDLHGKQLGIENFNDQQFRDFGEVAEVIEQAKGRARAGLIDSPGPARSRLIRDRKQMALAI